MRPIPLSEARPEDGAKAHGLARLLAAGFRVPAGFSVSAAVSAEEVVAAWRALQSPPVAVRSSSAVEDGQTTSFAGQFETVLDVADESGLVAALERTRASFAAPQSYLPASEGPLATGGSVIVQRMVAARAAGVAFTRDPTRADDCARIEACPGRGDALVSGRARPASWRVDSGGQVELLDGPPCLDEAEVRAVGETVRRVRQLLGGELDVEFAFEEGSGELWLLQARPITAVRPDPGWLQAEIDRVRHLAQPDGTVWSRYSLAETLPSPLPMTWSIVRRMLSGRGAYGRLYRDLGFDPDPSLDDPGVLDLICGRPYYNLSREVRLYFGDFPFVHALESLRADPRRASYPTPQVDLRRAPPGFWGRLPSTLWRMARAQYRLERLRRQFGLQLSQRLAPAFLDRIHELGQQDLTGLDPSGLVDRLRRVTALVADDFAADALKASAFTALCVSGLERRIGAAETARRLGGVRPRPEADLAGWLGRARRGEVSLDQLLQAIGHRGPAEMELAEPRWREMPQRLLQEVEGSPLAQAPPESKEGDGELALARDWMSLRETARHWLMWGWAEMRRNLMALDDRLGLEGGVFWLEWEELAGSLSLASHGPLIAERRERHRRLASIYCPPVLFSDDLEAIGRPPETASGDRFAGIPLSWGVKEGEALVVSRVEEVPASASGYVLVCPSTDPGYTFAMTRAVALVVETGGVLSHGAIVARELGLPAVAGIPAHNFVSGMRLRVDGEQGVVTRLDRE